MAKIEGKTVDWAKIEAEYVNSKDSLSTLSVRFGIPLKTVKRHSAAGKWSEKRRKYAERKAKKVSDKLNERDTKKTLRDIERCCEAAGRLIDKVNTAIRQIDRTVYVSLDDTDVSAKEEELEDGTVRVHTVKKRSMKTRQQKTLVDTKKLSEIAKALVSIKAVLTGEDGRADETEHSGVIEIAAAEMIDEREEHEEDMDAAAEAGGDDVPPGG